MHRTLFSGLVIVVATALFTVLRPLVVSGDGVGYIKRLVSPERDIVPGHLIYVPLLESLRRTLFPDGGHADSAMLATFFSSLAGGIACGLLFWLTARLSKRIWAGLFAAVGLFVSYGFYRASGDVEAYSTSVAIMIATACVLVPEPRSGGLSWSRVVGAGCLLALATLFHTSLVFFTLFVAVAVWMGSKSWPKTIAVMVVGGLISALTFLAVATLSLGYDLSEAIAWIRTSDNGYAQPPSLSLSYIFRNLGRLVYGVGRTFVHSPAPDRLGMETSVHTSAMGMGYLIVFAVIIIWSARSIPAPLRRRLRSLWAWVLPLLLFGFIFFPAATERWVFVLPCIWLIAGLALAYAPKRWVTLVGVPALLLFPLLANIVTVSGERALDRRTLDRSRAISQILEEGDLLLYPGHTWDEYIGFYEDAPVERFILASFAGEEQGDREAFMTRLEERLEATFERGGRVIAVRVFDAPDSHHGWSLLRALNIPRDDILALLARYEAEELIEDPVAVYAIVPPARETAEARAATDRRPAAQR